MAARTSIMRRFGGAIVAALGALALTAPAAQADGGLLGSVLGTTCPGSSAQPFLRWLDPLHYSLVPGGDFEGGAAGWALSGGAAVASGNESFSVSGHDDSSSLSLPSGSSALSPPACVGAFRPTVRLFVSNSGSPLSVLRVQIVYRGLTGVLGVVEGGLVVAGPKWTPTLPMLALQVPILGATSAQFRFTPIGGGSWRIDDVYVDPFAWS